MMRTLPQLGLLVVAIAALLWYGLVGHGSQKNTSFRDSWSLASCNSAVPL